jgi:nitrate/nitrite-specific signal transduction histidine kinase
MKVKDRLSLLFTLMFAILLLLVLTGIYLFVNKSRIRTFYDKLDDRAFTVAQFYLAEDNLSKENFKGVLKKFPQSLSNEYIRIYDDHYKPQFIPENSVHWDINIIKNVIEQKKVHLSQGNRQITGIYYVDNSGNFIIMVSAIDESGINEMNELGLIMFFFFGASLIITFFIGRIFSRITLLPIVKITSNLKTIRSTSLNLRLPIKQKKTDEIDSLSLTINQLLEHLEQSFESQRSFIANASHELRTPITTMRNTS